MSKRHEFAVQKGLGLEYRREIDGLRAIAVLPVILFHAGFTLFSGGFVGVDIFFVISGYLITTIILADKDNNKFSLVKFYERRARRILPVLFFVMLCCLPFAWFWLPSDHLKEFSLSLVAVSGFVSNVFFWQESGYFATAAEMKPLLHTWSLAVEEQFYIIFPLFLILIWKFSKRCMLWSLLVITCVSLAFAQWGAHNIPRETFFLLPSRIWEISVGALIAFFFLFKKSHIALITANKKSNEVLSFIGLTLICCSIFAFDKSTPFPGLFALIPTIGTGLVIMFSSPRTFVGRFLGTRMMVGVGLLSYSSYLWHQPLFVFARHRSAVELSTQWLLFLSAASIALAYLSWRYVEVPFRNRDRVSVKMILSFALISPLIFIVIGCTGSLFYKDFDALRFGNLRSELLHSAEKSPKRDECHATDEKHILPQDACEYFGQDIRLAVFGDSHAVELSYSLAQILENDGLGIKHISLSGCSPTYGQLNEKRACVDWTNAAVDYILNDKKINTVVVSYRINAYLYGLHEETYPRLPDKINNIERESRWSSLLLLLETFADSGKKVFLVLQAPELRKPVTILIKQAESTHETVGIKRRWWEKRNSFINERKGEVGSRVTVIDPADFFCDSSNCYATKDSKALYFDDDHMSIWGAKYVAEEIVKNWGVKLARPKSY